MKHNFDRHISLVEMERFNVVVLYYLVTLLTLLICSSLLNDCCVGAAEYDENPGGSQHWNYVTVRPKAHMFWWLYKSPYRVEDPNKPWPIILWLQGGPGASGVAVGNFQEIGPRDVHLKPRNSTWLKKADLLFVDCPVGTGYSYVEDTKLLVKTDVEAAKDLTTLLIKVFNDDASLQKSPLYIVAESYGGKFAVTLGLSALQAIETGNLKLKLGGVALGDAWISPVDYVLSWGPLLKDVSRIDENGLNITNRIAKEIEQKVDMGQLGNATDLWSELEDVIGPYSNSVNFYNFLLDSDTDPLSAVASKSSQILAMKRYASYLTSLKKQSPPGAQVDIATFMDTTIRNILKIIPNNITWGGQSDLVFDNMIDDYMRPRIQEVDELLSKGVNVTIYNGQVDLICATKGTEAWVQKLRWEGLKAFKSMSRSPLYCGDKKTRGFLKAHKNLKFYWILGAGHFVPVEQPCVSLQMVGNITQSPATLS